MATPYYLREDQFKQLFLVEPPRGYYEYDKDGNRGAQLGISFPCANASHSYDKVVIKIEGLAEAGSEFDRFKDDVPPETEISFSGLKVKQFVQKSGFGLGLSATADDVTLHPSKSTVASPTDTDSGSSSSKNK